MRPDLANQTKRGFFRKKGDIIDRLQSGKDPEAVFLGIEGASGPFKPPHGGVGIEAHHEEVSEALRLFKVGDMPRVKEIKTAIREDDPLSRSPRLAGDPPKRAAGLDFIPERGQDLPRLQRAREVPRYGLLEYGESRTIEPENSSRPPLGALPPGPRSIRR